MKNLKLALIGKDVSKSTSPQIHKFIAGEMGNCVEYEKLSVPEPGFESIADKLFENYDGFNVTIPYKLSIIPHLKNVLGDARTFGAVNTVLTSTRSGYNTDGEGFSLMLKNNGVEVNGKAVLVLGAGGAGRSSAKKLLDAGAHVSIYDVNQSNAVAVANEFGGITPLNRIPEQPYYLIVNASGVGMHKTEGISPVSENLLNKCTVAVDLIYVPAKSRFLEIAECAGKQIINGEAMLFYQAYYSQCIYFGVSPDEAQAKILFEKFKESV